MPANHSRNDFLKLIKQIMLIVLTDSRLEISDVDKFVVRLATLYLHASTTRYIQRARVDPERRSRSMAVDIPRMLDVPELDFRREFRVSRSTFYDIIDLVKDNTVYEVKPNGRPQASVEFQVAVAFWRMAHNGDGASVSTVARTFGCGEGSVVHYSDRFVAALLSIESDHTYWPCRSERKRIERQFKEERGIPSGCVGVVDGCHVVLWARPGTQDFGDFYNRKGSYSYNIQMAQVGFAGSAHDARVYGSSWFLDEEAGAFDVGQYVLADSAYPPGDHCVSVFRREAGATGFSGDEGKFNYRISRARVIIEHTYGLLKGRFSSLQGLRVGHTRPEDQARAGGWIRACIVLHNFIHRRDSREDDLTEEEQAEDIRTREMADDMGSRIRTERSGTSVRKEKARYSARRRALMLEMGSNPPMPPGPTGRAARSEAKWLVQVRCTCMLT